MHISCNERLVLLFGKVKSAVNKVLPKYAFIPLLMAVAMNFFTYYGTQFITNYLSHFDVSFLVSDNFQVIPGFIYIYILAYIQWIIGYIVIARENKQVCYEILSAELIAKLFCFISFLIFPTTMERPLVVGSSFSVFLVNSIYLLDPAINLFPSIHCLESWMCFRGSQKLKKVSNWYLIGQFIFAVLVFLSTIFVRQHVWIDIIGGFLAVEVGLFIARKYHTGQIFEKIEKKFRRN